MDFETQLAINILKEDIGLHRQRLSRPEQDSLRYLWFLSNDIWNKEDMIKDIQMTNPSKAALAEHIYRIKNTYIPGHQTGTSHDETWVGNYNFLKNLLRMKMDSSINP